MRTVLFIRATAPGALTWISLQDGHGREAGWHGMMGTRIGFELDYWSLKLSDGQRDKILAVELGVEQALGVLGNMREQSLRMRENYATGKLDDEALRKNYEAMSDVDKAMFEASLQARKGIEAILTPEQREQLTRLGPPALAGRQTGLPLPISPDAVVSPLKQR